MKQPKHWQDVVNVVIGIWLVVSVWILGLAAETVVTTNAVIAGLALIAVALGAILVPRAWEEWTEALLGLWLIASPWVLGFSANVEARFAAVLTGLVVLVLALWALATDRDYLPWQGRERLTQH